ncbi:threonine synthase [Hydrogenimonas thermophila]|uniref:threonine synthase n=1 Tax=Hydrogenimonas thermophila TaxID=223786 RepID=UPI0029370009|nr:threonine synthase [Hydrogenimonas thermophila]WOE71086.1 threonine synthase [Hydrogenimonas thermophila]WOE73604.1 threonine synthase [Hydrogenimonas thermophila]
MTFIETRGNDGVKPAEVTFSQAILSPSASFGGLYVPKKLPTLDFDFFKAHSNSHYKELCKALFEKFDVDIAEVDLNAALDRYDAFDDPNDPVPLKKVEDDAFVSELWHGPTRAFKDMALQPFGYILSKLAEKRKEHYLIMAATSGDTGPATLETFKNASNVKVACLYPGGGTSDVQRLQMVTEEANNEKVIGINGDFDDAQTALKSLLASDSFKAKLQESNTQLSAANSVNFGRIIFQIIYHVHSYLELVKRGEISLGETVYLVVPSGNFGNALGGYYAKKMGLPVEKILISSNINNILTDLITKGEYDLTCKSLIQTTSPAMDILKSSNVERILFDKFGSSRTKQLMDDLAENGKYKLTHEELEILREDFDATFSSDEEGKEVIAEYAKKGYIMDPHTATCFKAYKNLRKKSLKTIIYSTAEWTKFSPTVCEALGREVERDLDALKWISEKFNVPVPKMIAELFEKQIVHKTVIDKEKIEEEILKFI